MSRNLFLIKGNICGDRVRIGRAIHKPPLTQEDLARKMQLMGMDMTGLIISRIEKGQRHVVDAELKMLANALGVSMDWLCADE
ncbi:MAG: helix-turn-helix transcriptional regulator [Oscillospiraceae bacterium]|nr:helix-turn-helix transcriptional regulator [Oscillospiraceae bacterium]